MDAAELSNTLTALCELDGDTVFLDAVEAKARVAFLAGNGVVGAVTAVSANGKSVSKTIELSAGSVLACIVEVRKRLNGTAVPHVVYLDYSGSLG